MKLIIMRHAEALPSVNGDLNRELSEYGIMQAQNAAKTIQKYKIDKALVSYAKRTMQTAHIVMENAPTIDLEIVEEFYHGNYEDMMNIVSSQDSKYKTLLLIGHNPIISHFALKVMQSDHPDYFFVSGRGMSTAQIVIV
ncbi:MAG: hypothetical protein DGJ47_000154 [Rickettsiaceae bacterium]